MQDTDLAGPLVFCLAFGGSLMLVGLLFNPLSQVGNFINRAQKLKNAQKLKIFLLLCKKVEKGECSALF